MNVSINFVIPDPAQLAIFLIIGLVTAVLVGLIGGIRSLLSVLLLTVLAAIGAWLTVSFIRLQTQPEVIFGRVRLIEAIAGALIFGLAWALFLTRRKLLIK